MSVKEHVQSMDTSAQTQNSINQSDRDRFMFRPHPTDQCAPGVDCNYESAALVEPYSKQPYSVFIKAAQKNIHFPEMVEHVDLSSSNIEMSYPFGL